MGGIRRSADGKSEVRKDRVRRGLPSGGRAASMWEKSAWPPSFPSRRPGFGKYVSGLRSAEVKRQRQKHSVRQMLPTQGMAFRREMLWRRNPIFARWDDK